MSFFLFYVSLASSSPTMRGTFFLFVTIFYASQHLSASTVTWCRTRPGTFFTCDEFISKLLNCENTTLTAPPHPYSAPAARCCD